MKRKSVLDLTKPKKLSTLFGKLENKTHMPKLKKDQQARVRLSTRGPHITPETMRFLKLWKGAYGLPFGRSIDCAIAFAVASPGFKLSTMGARKSLKVSPLTLEDLK